MAIEFSKNNKQDNFNKVVGILIEKNDEDIYCSITLSVGKSNPRPVNFCIVKEQFDKIIAPLEIGKKVEVFFYLRSKKSKNGKVWFNYNNILGINTI